MKPDLPFLGETRAEAARPHAGAVDPAFEADVLAGLAQPQKRISSIWLYDRRGSELFEQITHLPEYYPTRTETRLLAALAPDLVATLGGVHSLVEIGSGSSRKTRLLLAALPALRRYVPVDISADFLREASAGLAREFPRVAVQAVVADFTAPFALPPAAGGPDDAGTLGFFPGSTIGNFTPEAASALLALLGDTLGPGARLLIGVDTTQDPARLLPAYDDAAGVTAEFNLNLLDRIDRELGADFDRTAFDHQARHDAQQGRIEMHLVSRREQVVHVRGRAFAFARGESIHTENCYKYTAVQFLGLAEGVHWLPERAWRDEAGTGFTVFLLRRHD